MAGASRAEGAAVNATTVAEFDGVVAAAVARLRSEEWDEAAIVAAIDQLSPLLAAPERERAVAAVASHLGGLGVLEPLLNDETVTDVMVHGDGHVWVESSGQLRRLAARLTHDETHRIIERVLGPLGLQADPAHPIADARLPDGTRVAVVVAPIAVDGPVLAVRRFATRSVPLASFGPPPVEALLRDLVARRCNVVIFGGTGAGKTTLLNALAGTIAHGERVITVEDTAELRIPGAHVVRLEARPANSEGAGAVALRDLVRAALRLRPDRVVVGEVRGAEAGDMIAALSTGHSGGMSTCHAGGPSEALDRLAEMAMMGEGTRPDEARVLTRLCRVIDVLVGVERTGDGRRVVSGVWEVPRPGRSNSFVPLVWQGRVIGQLGRDRVSQFGRDGGGVTGAKARGA